MPPAMLARAHEVILQTATPEVQTHLIINNLKTAKALGLTIPQSVLVRADDVIQ